MANGAEDRDIQRLIGVLSRTAPFFVSHGASCSVIQSMNTLTLRDKL